MLSLNYERIAEQAVECKFMESRMEYILDRKQLRSEMGPYMPRGVGEVEVALRALFAAEGLTGVLIKRLRRLAGGASKEQFVFELQHDAVEQPECLVLRMDTLEGVLETCRLRETQVMRAMAGVVPVPWVRFVDPEGQYLGHPGMVIEFVAGVTKPSSLDSGSVSGIGASLGEYTDTLAAQYMKYLAAIHDFVPSTSGALDSFDVPSAGTKEAPLWQVNLWGRILREDRVEPVPLLTLTEWWLRENAPVCERPCIVHNDFRPGNFMFEEPSGRMTAVLDWEMAHFGDFHEDIAYAHMKHYETLAADGQILVCGLMPHEDFLRAYEAASGRTIDLEKLHYYMVFHTWKNALMSMCSAVRAGSNHNSHQDLLLVWLTSVGPVFVEQLANLIGGE